jgi:hypothetical protein
MATIPQVARTMREILTTTADDAAHTTRFVQRQSRLGGATLSQTLVFGFLAKPDASLEELAQTAAAVGVALTPQALDQRFTEAAAACLKEVLHAALARVIAAAPVAIPLLARFTAVSLQDSSTIVWPDALAPVWQGCGGSTSERTTAALKLQVRLEMRSGRLDVQLQEGWAADQAAEFPGPLDAGALHMAGRAPHADATGGLLAVAAPGPDGDLRPHRLAPGAAGAADGPASGHPGHGGDAGRDAAPPSTPAGRACPPGGGRDPAPAVARSGPQERAPGEHDLAGPGGVDAPGDQCARRPLDVTGSPGAGAGPLADRTPV